MSSRTIQAVLRPGESGGGVQEAGLFVAHYTGGPRSTAPFSVSLEGIEEGDLIVSHIATRTSATTSPWTPPAGFTRYGTYSPVSNNAKFASAWKLADGTETDVTWTITSAGADTHIVARVYRPPSGQSFPESPIDGSASGQASGDTLQAPAVTTTVDGVLMSYGLMYSKNLTPTLPEVDDRYRFGTSNANIISGDLVVPTAGAAPQPALIGSTTIGLALATSLAIKPPA